VRTNAAIDVLLKLEGWLALDDEETCLYICWAKSDSAHKP
jgi:hypothetical protein